MARVPAPPEMNGLKRRIAQHRAGSPLPKSTFVRETFCLARDEAREKAREWFRSFPKAAYWTEVESWRQIDEDRIEFTMRRLPTAD